MASLPVYFEQRLVGTINVDKSGPGFTYDPAWIGLRGAFPISITMPQNRSALPPTLSALGSKPPARKRAAANSRQLLGMARSDVIGLLSAIGGDTAGALSMVNVGEPLQFNGGRWASRKTLRGS